MSAVGPRWRQVEELFHAALERPAPERRRYLEGACAGEPELLAEVGALLAADEGADRFLERSPAPAARATPRAGDRVGAWTLVEPIGEGGMGSVWRARRDAGGFEQLAALKRIRPGPGSAELVERFHRERRTLSRLEHPYIARLLDGGADDDGSPFFAMQLVEGEAIDAACDRVGLPLRARVELFLRVCDAVHYAHQRLIVHRDLKPANVLVDRRGDPQLLDFGIAKVLAADEDGHDTRLTVAAQPMTPAFASPEQLRGEPVTTASDVYSLGVMLYELLCGASPYAARGGRELETAIREREPRRASDAFARAGEPDAREAARRRGGRPEALRRELAGDLDAILARTLRKEPERRYASAADLALDLERWLRGRPVAARRDTWRYRASKLLRRHRAASAALAVLLCVSIAAAVAVARSARVAEARLAEILRLADLSRLDDQLAEAGRLWPVRPDKVPELERWIERSRALVERLPLHRATLAELRAARGAGTAFAGEGSPAFASTEERWRHDKLSELVRDLEAFAAPETGALADVERRLAFARTVEARSVGEHAGRWAAIAAELADPATSAPYEPLALAPQVGLVPLGRDPSSRLFEFADLATGAVPARAADGTLEVREDTGLVFVLIPGGAFAMGARRAGPGEAAGDGDPLARPDEAPVHEATLAPYLLSKYEMTQGQWLRATGANPSVYRPPQLHGPHAIDLAHPVEQVSWEECERALARLGLVLPTEAQWERAARGGTRTPWSSGAARDALAGAANLCDRAVVRAGAPWPAHREWPELDDGHVVHARVGSFRANPFGLHDVHGNVWEWCADAFLSYEAAPRPGDGLREGAGDGRRVGRGGAFTLGPSSVRSSHRGPGAPDSRDNTIGVRPARPIDGGKR